jgi:hypothetical protein
VRRVPVSEWTTFLEDYYTIPGISLKLGILLAPGPLERRVPVSERTTFLEDYYTVPGISLKLGIL